MPCLRQACRHVFALAWLAMLHTGDAARFGTPQYASDAHFLTRDGAAWLAGQEPALVGIDAVNIDDTESDEAEGGGHRPAHSILLAAGIPIVEHLTGLAGIPVTGATFTAVPPRIAAFGTFPVRAYASLPGEEPHDHLRSGGHLPTTEA